MTGSSWKILACALAWSVTLCAGEVRSACQDTALAPANMANGSNIIQHMICAADKRWEDAVFRRPGHQGGRVTGSSASCGQECAEQGSR